MSWRGKEELRHLVEATCYLPYMTEFFPMTELFLMAEFICIWQSLDFIHMTELFSTGTACATCDKYEMGLGCSWAPSVAKDCFGLIETRQAWGRTVLGHGDGRMGKKRARCQLCQTPALIRRKRREKEEENCWRFSKLLTTSALWRWFRDVGELCGVIDR